MIISGTNCSCSNDTSIIIGYDPSIVGDECSTPCASDTSENCGDDNSMIIKETRKFCFYGKYCKISNNCYLPKRHRRTAQT